MNYLIKEKIQETKGYLKGLAVNIRRAKLEFKLEFKNSNDDYGYTYLRELKKLQYEYRSHHIAYSIRKKIHNPLLSDGNLTEDAKKRYKQIEFKVREYNEPDWKYIEKIIKSYPTDEDVEVCDDETVVCFDS